VYYAENQQNNNQLTEGLYNQRKEAVEV